VIFGPGGSGKQRAGTLPICCTWPHSLICIDVKREHVHVTQESRGRFGPSSVVDPFGGGLRWNPLDVLDPASPTYVEDVMALGKAICSGLRTVNLRFANKSIVGPALGANTRARGPTLGANGPTLICEGLANTSVGQQSLRTGKD